jgi:DNA-binding MarR family transcriptional regulator
MQLSLHYLLLLVQNTFQKEILSKVSTIGLLPGQPKILDFLNQHDGCSQIDVAKGCCLEPATVTGILGRMETSGLIEKKQLGNNKRSFYVFLTEKGRQCALETDRFFSEAETQALKGISEEEQQQFMSTFKKIYENIAKNNRKQKESEFEND